MTTSEPNVPDDVIEAMGDAFPEYDTPVAIRSDMKKALAAAESKGWRLVPREPTQQQIADALEEGRHHMEYGQYSVSCQYRAMYDAAPKVKP